MAMKLEAMTTQIIKLEKTTKEHINDSKDIF